MISMFGIVSIVIVLVSAAAIVLHNRIMKKRAPVDMYLEELEEQLRKRVEMLYHASPRDSDLYSLCDQCIDLDLSGLLNAMPDIDTALEDYPPTSDDEISALEENTQAIQSTEQALNQAIESYNDFITRPIAGRFMALVLGFETEEI